MIIKDFRFFCPKCKHLPDRGDICEECLQTEDTDTVKPFNFEMDDGWERIDYGPWCRNCAFFELDPMLRRKDPCYTCKNYTNAYKKTDHKGPEYAKPEYFKQKSE